MFTMRARAGRAGALADTYAAGVRARARFGAAEHFWAAVRHGEAEIPRSIGMDDPAHEAFFAHGLSGLPIPRPAGAWRIGAIPEGGASWNSRDQRWEPGISALGGDGTFELFNPGPRRRIEGYLLWRSGSDGEPLFVDAIEI